MITDRDRNIFNHIERFNFATIEHIQKCFFREQKYGYDVARRRLNLLVKHEYLKCSRNYATNQNIYYIDATYKKPSLHAILLMNYYSELVFNGGNVVQFEKEKEIAGGKVRTDGFCIFEFNGYKYYQVIEVHVSHNKLNLNKYEDLEVKNDLLQICNGILPNLVLIDDVMRKSVADIKDMDIVHLDFTLEGFPKVFI